ncbi:MAG TPA: hypothetical protein VEX86_00270 [Longimicrobium sp.]|nr:hypothetical protein [Longimicrobium sp.]
MTRTITATYDGRDIHPDEPLPLPRDTRITITVHAEATDRESEPLSAGDVEQPRTNETFAEAVRRIRIDGPADWSQRVDDYLGRDLGDAAD